MTQPSDAQAEADLGPAEFNQRAAACDRLLGERRWKEALELAQALQREAPRRVAAYRLLSSAHRGLGENEESERALTGLLEAHSRWGSMLTNAELALDYASRAIVRMQLHKTERAVEDALTALDLDAQQPDALYVLTATAMSNRQYEPAQQYASRFVAAAPGAPEPQAWLAKALFELGRHEEALAAARRARELGDQSGLEAALKSRMHQPR